MMNRLISISSFVLSLAILNRINISRAKQIHPVSDFTANNHFHNKTRQWLTTHRAQFHQTQLPITPPVLVAGVLCFIAAALSSAGGIGGGGLFIPILTIVAGVDLKTASSLSAFMVTGGSIANVLSNFCSKRSKSGGKCLIDFDIALLTDPCMLLGVSIGVLCNRVFPEWMITVLFAIFLAWSTLKTCKRGMVLWILETEELRNNGSEKLEDGTEPLLGTKENVKLRLPLMKLSGFVSTLSIFFVATAMDRYGFACSCYINLMACYFMLCICAAMIVSY